MKKLPKAPKLRNMPIKHRAPPPKSKSQSTPSQVARSQNILAHDYSPKTGLLTITFRGGRRYSYDGVPKDLADEMNEASSKGTFIRERIIGSFKHTKLED